MRSTLCSMLFILTGIPILKSGLAVGIRPMESRLQNLFSTKRRPNDRLRRLTNTPDCLLLSMYCLFSIAHFTYQSVSVARKDPSESRPAVLERARN
jgi:hypothetical protein